MADPDIGDEILAHPIDSQTKRESEAEVHGKNKLKDKAKKMEEDKMDQKKRDQLAAAHREQMLAARNQAYVISYLEKKTRFDKDQVRALQKMFRAFKLPNQKDMDRLRFREMVASLLGITDNVMLDRIFNAFDGDNEGSVSESEWIIGLSVQLRGTLDQQTAYAYDVYDFNGDRSLGREEVHSCLHKTMHVIPGILESDEIDDAINELVELSMRKFDVNRDLVIRFSEYRHIVRQDPLLMEAFGECLPNERAAVPLIALLDSNPRKYSYYLSPPGDSAWSRERQRYLSFKGNEHHEGYVMDLDADEGISVSPVTSMSVNPLASKEKGGAPLPPELSSKQKFGRKSRRFIH